MKKLFIILAAGIIALCMYLYVTANPPVGSQSPGGTFAYCVERWAGI